MHAFTLRLCQSGADLPGPGWHAAPQCARSCTHAEIIQAAALYGPDCGVVTEYACIHHDLRCIATAWGAQLSSEAHHLVPG